MKIAKKVLAVVMALAMVGCFAAMAFADDAPAGAKFELKVEGDDVILYAKNLVGLKSFNLDITYNDAVAKVAVKSGKDAKTVNDAEIEGNSFTKEVNTKEKGKINYGAYFKENLWDTAKWEAEGVEIADAKNFAIAKFDITLADGKTMNDVVMDLKLTACSYDKVECVGLKKAEVKPAETKPAETKPAETKPAETKPAETKPAKPDGPKTGDTGILAIAAGVVALAGAAFVISKKRK